jgi:hypothetical protein
MDDVVIKSQQLVSLGTDLAATYGYDVQEALLGMTALFRGEYDPIEKFGVAMKQAEVNAILAERGLDKLTGAAFRNAEQTARYEILIERSTDALGAFAAQSGSLFTEQKKLGASFENMQAKLGTALLPAIVGLNQELRILIKESTPMLIAAFESIAAGLEGLLGVFNDAMDPSTELGESFAALNIQVESLAKTLGEEEFEFDIFELGSLIIRSLVNLFHDLLRSLEDIIINIQVAGQAINDFFTNRDKFNNTDYLAMRKELLLIADQTKDNKLALEIYKAEWKKTQELKLTDHTDEIQKTADAWERALRAKFNYNRPAGLTGTPDSMERQLAALNAGLPAGTIPDGTGGSGSGGTGGSGGGSSAVVKEVLKIGRAHV